MEQPLWKTVWKSSEVKHRVTTKSTARYLPNRTENIHSCKHLYMNVHSSIIRNRQMVKANLHRQNHTKKHKHTHLQKEKMENIYIYI